MNCASALKPILPKSQAWCVDGSSKFVLQIRPPQYWRIEVPNKTSDESLRVDELKKVLDQVLRYEKTPCPFQRDFVVELPERPSTPIKKRPWKPIEMPQSPSIRKSSPLVEITAKEEEDIPALEIAESRPSTPSAPEPSTVGKRPISPPTPHYDSRTPMAVQLEGVLSPIDAEEIMAKYTMTDIPESLNESSDPSIVTLDPKGMSELLVMETTESDCIFGTYLGLEEDSDSFSDATDDTNQTPRNAEPDFQSLSQMLDQHGKPPPMQSCSRSVTAPPVLSLVTSPPSKQRTKSPLRRSMTIETNSDCSSSVDSFHSIQSWHSPLAPPSPPASGPSSPTTTYPYPHENITLPKRSVHVRDGSELTASPETPKRTWEMDGPASGSSASRGNSQPPSTPALVKDGSEKSDEEKAEIATPPTVRPTIRHRATTSSNSRRRALSPLPPAVNLFSPPPRRKSRRLKTARHLPTAIIQKTCEILLSPPSHLFHLMLSIASKIAAGEWRGVLSGHGEAVHWDFEDEYGGDAMYEDDYGMSLVKSNASKAQSTKTNATGGSWEVD